MTIKQAIEIFDRVYDNFQGNEGLEIDEICVLMNTGLLKLINSFFSRNTIGSRKPGMDFEGNEINSEDFSALIHEPLTLTPSATGRIQIDDIRAFLPQINVRIDGEPLLDIRQAYIHKILSVRRWWSEKAKYRKCTHILHNEYPVVADDALRMPIEKYPIYRNFSGYLQVDPQSSNQCEVVVLREPAYMWLNPSVAGHTQDPEVSDKLMIYVIFEALILAGVGVRDGQMYSMIQGQMAQI